jgi:RHS repeat-associated protein
LLHEWNYPTENRPKQQVSELGEVSYELEPTENVTTWVYDEGSYTPIGKLLNGERYSIISDYLGRPVQSFNDNGELVWGTDYDIYGRLKNLQGEREFIPFRQMGQYEDMELGGVYYNRFRYYDSTTGLYLSQDPIGLAGGTRAYAYVFDSNHLVDVFGLMAAQISNLDFTNSPHLFPHENAIVKIKMQGSRSRDFTEAYKKSGIDRKLAEDKYTWHHVHDFDPITEETTMQLVKREVHDAIPHKGSVSQFKAHFNIKKYTTRLAEAAKKMGSIVCK